MKGYTAIYDCNECMARCWNIKDMKIHIELFHTDKTVKA